MTHPTPPHITPEMVEAAYLSLRDGEASKGYLTIETVSAAIAAALAVQWRPIETAPKDGAFVLLFVGGTEAWCPTIGRWNGDGWGDELSTFHTEGINMPTHWQPLPLPPQEKQP